MAPAARWWLEWEFWIVLLLAGLTFGSRLGDVLPSGEEPRRGQVAREMIAGGDWIVPRQQGEPFLSRPPVQNWLIALAALARGKVDYTAIRLPSVAALLLTTALVYAFGRTFLSRLGALWAAAAYPTMGLVLQSGWLGETESLYTFLVAGSLIAWRWADARGRPLAGWCGGYALAALGILTKGPQAPIYFVAGVVLFLLVMRRGRELVRWQHALGICTFLAIWLAWEIPFCLHVNPHEAWTMLTGDVAMRFSDGSWGKTLTHVFLFPLSVGACTLPWGVLLLAYFSRDFRRGIAPVRAEVCFLGLSIGFAFLTCYAVPGARNRYLAPTLPLIALLIGLAAQQCCAAAGTMWQLRRHYFLGAGILAAGLGTWIVVATVFRLGASKGQQPPAFAAAFALAALAATTIAVWIALRPSPARDRLGVLTLTALLGLTSSGAIVNIQVARQHPIDDEIATAASRIPQGEELVSIGPVDDVFLYYYGRPIRRLPADAGRGRGKRPWTWFCMGCGPKMPQFDLPYEQIGRISMKPAHTDDSSEVVIIGRLIAK